MTMLRDAVVRARSFRRLIVALCAITATLALPSVALAQDAGADGSTGGMDSGTPRTWSCPGAITDTSQPVVFRRMGPVDFGPGTGMRSIGSRSSLGMEYNLIFSGRYDTEMRGRINVRWPRGLTLSATPDPMGGYLESWFGLRMMATLYVVGIPIPLPLNVIIDDNEGHGRTAFTPWAWNFEGTRVHINTSAWRTIYTTRQNVLGSDIEFQLQMRYNTDFTIRTIEIGFPDRSSPASMQVNLGVINPMMPETIYPPPPNGQLDLLTRWRSQIRYQGTLEFRLQPRCASSFDLICLAATGLLGAVLRPIETGAIAESRDILPDPYDQTPHYNLPVMRIDNTYIDFGDVRVGETVQLPIEVLNPGASVLAVEPGMSTDPAFRVGMGACIAPGATARIPVSFTPSRMGNFQTQIIVESNGTMGTPSMITLSGNGATMTRPAMPRVDAGRTTGDGGRRTGIVDAGCECRSGVRHSSGARDAMIAFAALATALAIHRRRRAH